VTNTPAQVNLYGGYEGTCRDDAMTRNRDKSRVNDIEDTINAGKVGRNDVKTL
jgi:hypothetical protein